MDLKPESPKPTGVMLIFPASNAVLQGFSFNIPERKYTIVSDVSLSEKKHQLL
jgi:hypothetical protein